VITDISTVLWREMIFLFRGSRSIPVLLRYLAFTLIFGAIIPWQAGSAWLRSPLPLLYWTWFAVYLASAATSGSFARERELHTLETLLATRLSDTAILLGKILSGVIYGGIFVLVSLIFGQIVLLFKGTGIQQYYHLSIGLGGYLVALLSAFAIGTLASLTSLKAKTSRQAQASLGMILLFIFLPLVIVEFLPGLQQQLLAFALQMNSNTIILAAVLALIVLDLPLWLLAKNRFRRNQLIRVA